MEVIQAGALALWREVEGTELVQSGSRHNNFPPVPTSRLSRRWSWLFTAAHGGKMRGNRLKLKENFSLGARKTFYLCPERFCSLCPWSILGLDKINPWKPYLISELTMLWSGGWIYGPFHSELYYGPSNSTKHLMNKLPTSSYSSDVFYAIPFGNLFPLLPF